MKKYSVSITALTVKNNSHNGFEDFPRTAFGERLSAQTGRLRKFCHKKSSLPVKRSR